MGRAKLTYLVAAYIACSSIGDAFAADTALRFARFMGSVLAIEDACPRYYVRTDAVMGNHLSPEDYQYAMGMVEAERAKARQLVKKLGCDKAAKEVMKLTDASFFDVWEIREQ